MKNENTVDVQHGNAEQSHSSFSSAKNTGVILRFNDLIVLAKRIEVCPFSNKKVNFGGYWSPFCGAVEEGETHEEAAVREVLEETGLVIDKNKLKILSRIRDLALFEYSLDKLEDIQLDYEHTESGYFRIEYINTLPTPMDEEIIQIIKKL